jgi:hypothetical protein
MAVLEFGVGMSSFGCGVDGGCVLSSWISFVVVPFVFCSIGVGFLPRSLVVDVEINAAGFPTIKLYPLLAG